MAEVGTGEVGGETRERVRVRERIRRCQETDTGQARSRPAERGRCDRAAEGCSQTNERKGGCTAGPRADIEIRRVVEKGAGCSRSRSGARRWSTSSWSTRGAARCCHLAPGRCRPSTCCCQSPRRTWLIWRAAPLPEGVICCSAVNVLADARRATPVRLVPDPLNEVAATVLPKVAARPENARVGSTAGPRADLETRRVVEKGLVVPDPGQDPAGGVRRAGSPEEERVAVRHDAVGPVRAVGCSRAKLVELDRSTTP